MSIESTKKRALRILGKRNFSEKEMYNRLVQKGEDESDARETVQWLAELGYINDETYATLIANHYIAKGYGQARVRDELAKRGIPRDYWEEKISVAETDDNSDPAVEFLTKKLRGNTVKEDLQKAKEALVRRGFSYDEANSAVKRYMEKTDE